MKIDVQRYQPGDVLEMDIQASQRAEADVAVRRRSLTVDVPAGRAITIRRGAVVLACGGIEPVPGAEHRAVAWGLTAAIRRSDWARILLIARRFIREELRRFTRIEAHCQVARPEQGRVLASFGMTHEADMAGWGPQGAAYSLYAIVREGGAS